MLQSDEFLLAGGTFDLSANSDASVTLFDDGDERYVAIFALFSKFMNAADAYDNPNAEPNETTVVGTSSQDLIHEDTHSDDGQSGPERTAVSLTDNSYEIAQEEQASVQEDRNVADYDAGGAAAKPPASALPELSAAKYDFAVASEEQQETAKIMPAETVLRATAAADVPRQLIEGDDTSEFLVGTFADEDIRGNGDNDTILNAGGNDILSGGDGSDLIVSISGSNVISGGDDFDFLIGGYQDDIIHGNGGDDLLRGDISTYLAGRDILIGGDGDDILEGGGGADLFVFSTGDGNDFIARFNFDFDNSANLGFTGPDFVVGVDKILLTDFGYASSVEALGNFTEVDGFATFNDQGTQFTIAGVSVTDLSADDIVLVTSVVSDSGDEDIPISGILADPDTAPSDHFCLTVNAENGLVTINADGSYTYTGFADFNGIDRFTYSVTDANGAVTYETVELLINPINDAPRDLTDAAKTGSDTPLSGALTAFDAEGDALTFSLIDAAETGTVVIDTDGSFVYTPASGFLGQDSFTYSVSDGNGGVTTETVTIDVTVALDEDDTTSGDLSASYPDATTLDFMLTAGPANGSLDLNANGAFTYAPPDDFNGSDSFTYTVSIDGGTPEIVTIVIDVTPLNDAPEIQPIDAISITETTDTGDMTGEVTVEFTDVDQGDVGHTASVTAVGATGDLAGLTLDSAGLEALLTLDDVTKTASSPTGSVDVSFNAASTVFDYLGEGDQVTITYELTIDDGDGGMSVQAFDVVITGTFDPVAPFDLAEVAQAGNDTGFVINGASPNSEAGRSVSSAGDVNGDGFDDVFVGATNGQIAGGGFVVFGQADGTSVELSDIVGGTGGFVITGDQFTGTSFPVVSNAGDVNDDGLDDLIIGLRDPSPNGVQSGASYVVFGKGDGNAVDLDDIEVGTGGFVINGSASFEKAGMSVSNAGDVNGDGFDDLFVGTENATETGASAVGGDGAGYVVFGKADGAAVEISDIKDGIGGFSITGADANDRAGISVSNAGDVNGDGFDDLIIGAKFADPNGSASGTSYVVFGKVDGITIDLADVELGTGGFAIHGISAADNAGLSVSNAGDVNGDGLDDLIVGAPFADLDDTLSGSLSGSSYVVFGKADGSAVELSDVVDGIGGFAFEGTQGREQVGRSVSAAGDINGDGLADLIVGSGDNGLGLNKTFVIFGKADGEAVLQADIEAGIGGFVITAAESGDNMGVSVSSAGDVNGDGFDDLIIGAPEGDPNGSDIFDQSGTSFVIFGGDFTGAATQIGTAGDDTIVGQDVAEALFGAAGNDIIAGNGGGDRLSGGAGSDTFVFIDTDGIETIADFEDGLAGQDIIDVSAFGFATAADVLNLAEASGPGGHDVVIQLDTDSAILLQNYDLSQLDAADFLV
ncbi:FG-GAP repeat protein [Yoonia maricola]|uniref:FG-GAP repeat protein n=1 Tax=Yoonia maricola TaxID=420999 RepID=A0A2M8WP01_9RHOB|nr:tandem-95 repeat protein [Yoonia maricola]PJI92631.1 FG-GAP repeat protein [Yoonia maricola]